MRAERLKFHLVMAGCGGFVVLMLAALAWVCLQPQTVDVQAAERHAIEQCVQRSEDPSRSEIQRRAQASSSASGSMPSASIATGTTPRCSTRAAASRPG